ncbi:MAG: sensor domain-containing protein [Propionibacteriales bacterium]|nr:sensor domain-containing protein [Propionibacteriales bacterium]
MSTRLEPTGFSTALLDPEPTVRTTPDPVPESSRPAERGDSPLHSVPHDLAYLIPGFVISVISFILLIILFSVGVGTAVIVIGLAVLAMALLMSSSFARENRRLLAAWQGSPVPAPTYASHGSSRRLLRTLTDPQLWAELLHGTVISFPLRVTTFSISVSWLVGGLGGLTYIIWGLFLPSDEGLAGLLRDQLRLLLPGSAHLANSMLNFIVGAIMVLTTPFVIRTMAGIDASVARVFLTNDRS